MTRRLLPPGLTPNKSSMYQPRFLSTLYSADVFMIPTCPTRTELRERADKDFREYQDLRRKAELQAGTDQIEEYCSVSIKAGCAFRAAMESWNQYFEHVQEHGCNRHLHA